MYIRQIEICFLHFSPVPVTVSSVYIAIQILLSAISPYLDVVTNEPYSFHLDHAASLPYVMAKTNFKGRVFMTHPTKAIYKWLMQDSVRVQSVG